jgi:hypothetical protein
VDRRKRERERERERERGERAYLFAQGDLIIYQVKLPHSTVEIGTGVMSNPYRLGNGSD